MLLGCRARWVSKRSESHPTARVVALVVVGSPGFVNANVELRDLAVYFADLGPKLCWVEVQFASGAHCKQVLESGVEHAYNIFAFVGDYLSVLLSHTTATVYTCHCS